MDREQSTNGVNRCVSCGSSDVSFDGSWLVCAYCHHRWNTAVLADELHLSEGIENLVGTSVLTGANDIDTSGLVTVTCDGCGAIVTINSASTLQATCHWCRHTLSLNNPVDNGAVPDGILPFSITRDDAATRMAAYLGEQGKFASPEFLRDFENPSIRAVYLPYLVVDGKVTVRLEGRAWVQCQRWPTLGSSEPRIGSADQQFLTEEFVVTRETDLLVDDLAIEARSTMSKLSAAVSTTNIINAIQPFDVKNAVHFNASYVAEGVAFEKRDLEVSDAMPESVDLFATIARGYVNQTLTQYTGGVRWESEVTAVKGTRWVTVLLPVWLYAFEETTPSGPMMHYLAVNGRTGETEGSIPTDKELARKTGRKWGWVAAALYEAVFGVPLLVFIALFGTGVATGDADPLLVALAAFLGLTFALPGLAFGRGIAKWRRNMLAQGQRKAGARLKPEFETKYTPTRLQQGDQSLGKFTHDGGPEIDDRNDHRPQDRAEESRFVLGELPQPVAKKQTTADLVWEAQRVTQRNARGGPLVGQPPSGPPPGTDPNRTVQLFPGGETRSLSPSDEPEDKLT